LPEFNEPEPPMTSVPPLIVVLPVYVLVPVSVTVPPTAFTVRPLPPEIIPEKFTAKALNVSVLEPIEVNV
jgi:hypothetical protein